MAATLREILLVAQAKQQRELEANRKKKPTAAGIQIALDILHHGKFPGDRQKPSRKKLKWPDWMWSSGHIHFKLDEKWGGLFYTLIDKFP